MDRTRNQNLYMLGIGAVGLCAVIFTGAKCWSALCFFVAAIAAVIFRRSPYAFDAWQVIALASIYIPVLIILSHGAFRTISKAPVDTTSLIDLAVGGIFIIIAAGMTFGLSVQKNSN